MAKEVRGAGKILVSEERRALLLASIEKFYFDEFDEQLSDFRAEQLLEFFVAALGAPIYNQAIQDARGFFAKKLEDLEGDLYEPEMEP